MSAKARILTAVAVLGFFVFSAEWAITRNFDIDVVGYDVKIHDGTDWLVAYLEFRNGTPFIAREVVIHTRHFDGESWLDWLHGTSAEDALPGEIRQVRWVYSTRANPEQYLGLVAEQSGLSNSDLPPMQFEVKLRWTIFGMFRRSASRVINL
ncbi:MAG TPA: hypothetical protein ENH62_17120 [Marinobacter sp.]|uniref:DUF4390 domain-containing protein n=1 Tax=marine sediment metagenome TaxID=412755 RepID=A0A0F9QFI9_9ZZZZ|nr:hypothetical protein [Marinobacter sp.]